MIHILNENLKKIDILRKYDFLQYAPRFRGIGTFTIHAKLVEENKYLLNKEKTYYVLFDFGELFFGEIINAKQYSSEEDSKIVITGKLENYLFQKKINLGTLSFSGRTYEYCSAIIKQNLLNDEQPKRKMNINVLYDNEEYLQGVCSSITKQITGGYIWEELEKVMQQDNLGIILKPVVDVKHLDENGNETNIDSWDLTISAGKDRTKKNKQGLKPIIFSQQLSNIANVDYSYDTEQHTNFAYIAGEGEEDNRKWFGYSNEEGEKVGWNRKELWIDARDIQSENIMTGEILSDEEYENLIRQRVAQKFSENKKFVLYETTVTNAERLYTYGEHFYLGDWCTVVDNNLKMEIDVQITEVTFTIQGSRKIMDLKLDNGTIKKDYDVSNIKSNKNKIETVEVNVKYANKKIEGIETDTAIMKNDIQNLKTKTANMKDYILYASDVWTVKKYSDGTAECYARVTSTVALATAWGSNYYVDCGWFYFPSNLFIEVPKLFVSVGENGGNCWHTKTNTTKTDTGHIFIVSPSSSTFVVNIDLIAKGRWK